MRKRIPQKIVEQVILSSRRRCCLCFGLERDFDMQQGQIAHLDKDNSNNKLDNLAFLCLNHHDLYDSRASQRKGLQIGEVKAYRTELYSHISSQLSRQVSFGKLSVEPSDGYSGTYTRISNQISTAEVVITGLPTSFDGKEQCFITGSAFWGIDDDRGPNMGFVNFQLEFETKTRANYRSANYELIVSFEGKKLLIEENADFGWHGQNVTFNGEYLRE